MIDECLVLQSWFYLTHLFKSFYVVYLQNMHGSVFKGIYTFKYLQLAEGSFSRNPKILTEIT